MSYMTDDSTDKYRQLSTDEWETRVGVQFRALRLRANLDQGALAELAGVSLGAVKHLEQGKGSSLKTLVRLSLALGHESWLESLSPAISISPIDVLRSRGPQRVRVYRPRKNAT
jgi:transcriptional regulator with XRE-family HTH domain